MVIFLNLDGSAEKITPQRIYQGSNNVTEITVIAPYPPDTRLEIGFILPDGLYWNEPNGSRYAPMGFVGQNAETRASAWNYVLPRSVTERQGEVCAAINARTDDGNTTSYLCRFVIEESVLPKPPSEPEPGVYALLRSYLARLDGRTANVPNLVAKIRKVAGNAFTYTNNSGEESPPIVINGGADAPIPVNTASTIKLPERAWQPVYSGQTVTGYTAEIQAEMHGQMRDGATARDLWLGFDIVSNAEIRGDYPEYKVNAAGDITLSANSPVAMTVRVWNGKSIVDYTARNMITAETERAEAAERVLQANIDAETERAEAAESELKEEIDTKASKDVATQTSNGLMSSADKKKLDEVASSSVTGVKGANETDYRTGNVNLTPEDIGAVKIGGELTADLNTVVENGIYRVSTGSTNVPENKLYGQMLVMHQADTVAQLYVWYSDGSIYARAGNPPEAGGSGQWSDWYKVAKDSEVVHKSGDTMTGPLNCPFNNNFIIHGNEFNFIPQGYNNDVFFNYRGGAVGDYHFTNGDSNGGLANIRAADVYDHGQRVFSPHNLPTALKDYADGQAAYLEYGSRALDLNEFTYLACWSGHVVRAVNQKDALPSGNGTDNGEGVVKYLSIPVIISLGSVVICYGRVSTSGSSAVFQDISFPVTYTYTPNVLTTYNGNNTGTIENLYGWVKQNSITTRGFTVRSYGGNSITYLAIGKIK